jgi:hypothetical protein
MHGGRSTGAHGVALALVAVMAVAGCGQGSALDGAAGAPVAPSAADLPAGLLDELADLAVAALPAVADRIPATEAELIGRRGSGAAPPAPADPYSAPTTGRPGRPAFPNGPAAVDPDPGELLGQRVLVAVRPALDGIALDAPAELVPIVRAPRLPAGGQAFAEAVGQDPTAAAAGRLRRFGPDVIPWVTAITGALAEHDAVAPRLRVGAGSEAEIVAAHGRAHLALAVVVAAMVVPAADVPVAGSDPAVVVGAAVAAATQVLRARPMPDAYAAALLERRRAEYQVPNFADGDVLVPGHRFALVEGALPPDAGEPADGLVTVVPGGVVVRTGAESGPVPVSVRVLAGPPSDDELAVWHDVVEVSLTADAGAASIVSDAGPGPAGLRQRTPPWPGPLRARVAARGRDDGDGERYEIAVWAAPLAPEVVLKASDRLGHRLRGEPEPPVVVRPEVAYRWLRSSGLEPAATVTVVTGSSPEQVVAAFGGDPARPVPVDEALTNGLDPWVAVLPVDGAVLAVEFNGYQGTHDGVLRAASARGRAASMYWNVDALTNLAFARDGEVVDSFEPLFAHTAPDPEVRAALAGIDWADYTDLHEKGLVAVEEFTGHGVRAQDVERIQAAAVGYRIPDSG